MLWQLTLGSDHSTVTAKDPERLEIDLHSAEAAARICARATREQVLKIVEKEKMRFSRSLRRTYSRGVKDSRLDS